VTFDTGTTFERLRSNRREETPTTFRDLCRPTSGRFFAKAKGRSGGERSPGRLPTLRERSVVLEMFPRDEHLNRWIKLAQKRVKFQGLHRGFAGCGRRAGQIRLALNDLVAKGELKAPIVIGRDHLIADRWRRRTAKRNRCWMDRMRFADWPLLNAFD